jgi:hypothetical protein
MCKNTCMYTTTKKTSATCAYAVCAFAPVQIQLSRHQTFQHTQIYEDSSISTHTHMYVCLYTHAHTHTHTEPQRLQQQNILCMYVRTYVYQIVGQERTCSSSAVRLATLLFSSLTYVFRTLQSLFRSEFARGLPTGSRDSTSACASSSEYVAMCSEMTFWRYAASLVCMGLGNDDLP